jgi:hypothetical protein
MPPSAYGVYEAGRGVVRLASGPLTATMLRFTGVRGFNNVTYMLAIASQLVYIAATRPLHLYLVRNCVFHHNHATTAIIPLPSSDLSRV